MLTAPFHHQARFRSWLLLLLFALHVQILIGGATRLTDSGLSITEWKPVTGWIPPLSQAAWEQELEKYSRTFEFKSRPPGFDLAEFRRIYWWEWGHRAWGRVLGLLLLAPLAGAVLRRRKLPRGHGRTLAVLFLLLGAQGFVGWWMVQSGLWAAKDVSHRRLAVHLSLAAATLLFTAREAGRSPQPGGPRGSGAGPWLPALAAALLAQLALGALVAGMHAGKFFNTWPLIEGRWWPERLWLPEVGPAGLLDNPLSVQFLHRTFAWVVLALALLHLARARAGLLTPAHARQAWILVALLGSQLVLGVVTLLLRAPPGWSLLHQSLGAVTVSFAGYAWGHLSRGPR